MLNLAFGTNSVLLVVYRVKSFFIRRFQVCPASAPTSAEVEDMTTRLYFLLHRGADYFRADGIFFGSSLERRGGIQRTLRNRNVFDLSQNRAVYNHETGHCCTIPPASSPTSAPPPGHESSAPGYSKHAADASWMRPRMAPGRSSSKPSNNNKGRHPSLIVFARATPNGSL